MSKLIVDNLVIKDKNVLNKNLVFKHLNLVSYKTKKCLILEKHNHKNCVFYHNIHDKRRSLIKYDYQIKMCKNSNDCNKKDNCNYSHNKIEILYHHDFYKKKYCEEFLKNNHCSFKDNCSFVHYDHELRIKNLHLMRKDKDFFLFHYKTEFCPLGNIEHDKKNCIYAHNYQDYKRKNINNLIQLNCRYWKQNTNYKIYKKDCKKGFNCRFCHGKYELLYNPINKLVIENYNLNYNIQNFKIVIKNRLSKSN